MRLYVTLRICYIVVVQQQYISNILQLRLNNFPAQFCD